ncbi:MAG TPA: preprotein translocase subunit SecG [Casimicrobiaceae bacterium]|nr:preprotein translocase subunit SecG [Casimicrobiaceae bacterium]
MNMLETGLLIIHVLVAAAICGFVLLQHGKGADMGAAFGSGASGSLFGAAGSANFLSRTTAILAAIFFASSLGLTWFATTRTAESAPKGVMEKLAPKASDIPSAPGAAPGSPAGTNPGAPPASDASRPPAAPSTPAPDGSKASEVPK